jgi:hypothetical protein
VAVIQRPLLPLYLYRYRAISPREKLVREIEAIKAPYLWCSDFTSLNDPMEGFYRPSAVLASKNEYERIVDRIANKKSNVGIASFSDTRENELMWTHYAGNYSGICVEYYAQRLLRALPSEVNLVHMAYGDVPPRITSKDVSSDEAAQIILSQKKFNWAYEREWRILARVGRLHIDQKDVVRNIYLGSRISDSDRKVIVHSFEHTDIGIHVMGVSGYNHLWERIPRTKTKRSRDRA